MSLELPAFFARLAPVDLEAAEPFFTRIEVEYGETLISEGEEDPSLFVVLRGAVAIAHGAVELAVADPGAIVGEIELFGDSPRITTAKAIAPCRILVLDRPGYEALRWMGSPVAWALEAEALRQVAARARITQARVEELFVHAEWVPALRTSWFEWLRTRLSFAWWFGPLGMDVAERLRDTACFRTAPEETLAHLAVGLRPRTFAPGEDLARQGTDADELTVLVEGNVDLLRMKTDGSEIRVGSAGAGQVIGAVPLVEKRPHALYARARSRVLAVMLPRERFTQLLSAEDAVGSALRTALIRALGEQIAGMNGRLAALEQARRRAISRELSALGQPDRVIGPA